MNLTLKQNDNDPSNQIHTPKVLNRAQNNTPMLTKDLPVRSSCDTKAVNFTNLASNMNEPIPEEKS